MRDGPDFAAARAEREFAVGQQFDGADLERGLRRRLEGGDLVVVGFLRIGGADERRGEEQAAQRRSESVFIGRKECRLVRMRVMAGVCACADGQE